MHDPDLQALSEAAAGLLLFQNVLQHPIGENWGRLLELLSRDPIPAVPVILRQYGQLFHAQATEQLSWTQFLVQQIRWDDNPFSRAAALHPLSHLPDPLIQAAQKDLRALQQLARGESIIQSRVLTLGIQVWWAGSSAVTSQDWDPEDAPDWGETLTQLAQTYRNQGVGLCAQFRAFRWANGQLQGIPHPDPVAMAQLYGYPRQRKLLCENTEALLARLPALHVLLYGARGTGKSSLVKALLHQYGDRGLRLLELNRTDLLRLPDILTALQSRSQTFILFVDDLSFETDEVEFKQLKVLLEGDITAQPANVRVYATSNRRHLIREFFRDRPDPANEEVHAWDTVQERLSLGDRFGLTLSFSPFNQAEYLETVLQLSKWAQLEVDPAQLKQQAVAWAQQQNGFSGRSARQFVDACRAQLIPT
ncbi:MAG: ATP-binding protein [Synechococcaceae cyanobacterium SM2_3_1]|nr:ATP-binding protein [Synechococcaceae cyanobacterium SM2_3_1]